MKKYIILILFILIVIGFMVGSYFLSPFGPVIILAFLLIQMPMIIKIIKAAFGKSYVERSADRRKAYMDGEITAGEWFKQEEDETKSSGFQNWSAAGRNLSCLNRAEVLFIMGKSNEGQELINRIEKEYLTEESLERYKKITEENAN